MSPTNRQNLLNDKTVAITCLVPVYNEEENITAFLNQLRTHLQTLTKNFDIIVIDDGSKDTTVEKILALPQDNHLKLLQLSRNFGKEIAITAGLDHSTGDVTIILDADFQHPIELISTFLQHWAEGYNMVYGVRQSRKAESRVKRFFANLFYWLMKKMTKIDIPNNAGDFRLLDKKVVVSLNAFNERTRFMKGLYAWVGYKRIAVPFEVQERRAGKSSWGFIKLLDLAVTGIASFSDIPLRIWSMIGFIISLIALIYAVYFLTITLLFGADLPGFPSIIVAVMFLGGVQLLSIGILGEYIARIFTEVKQRPKYIIEKKYGITE